MLNLFIHSMKMNMAIFSNTIIYRLRCLPLIKHIIPATLYGNEGIGAFVTIIMIAIKLLLALSKKVIYIIAIMLMLIYVFPNGDMNQKLLTSMMLFSLFGAYCNNKLLIATKEKYYSVVLMRIDANQYAKMDFVKEVVSDYIFMNIVLLITGPIVDLNIITCLLIPIYTLACKTIMTYIISNAYGSKLYSILENSYFSFAICFITIIVIAGCLQLQLFIPYYCFLIVSALFTLLAIYCFKKFMQVRCFKAIYKKKITLNNVIFNMSEITKSSTKKSLSKKITYDEHFQSNKNGYEYFNELFTKRHKKILTLSALRFAGVYLTIILVVAFVLLFFPNVLTGVNEWIMYHIPYFLIVMYFSNRGAIITQAMFVNCDSSMLTYRFYRRPEVILGLFKQRLKTVILVNMIPSLVIASGLCVLLFISGGTENPINYLLIFLCINAMSAFFSVHNLVLYYLLQPYNLNMQAKGTLYTIISTITYFVCYAFMNVKMDVIPFTITVIIFCIIYIFVSLAIAYKHAYKTFKIKN